MERPTTTPTQRAVHVLATTFEATRAALTTAIPLAKGSDSHLIVIVTQVVPFAVALDAPVDSTELTIRRYRDLVTDLEGQAQFRLCLCRRARDVVTRLLPRGATVVVGGPSGGLVPSQEVKLMRCMAKLGHHVVFVPMPEGHAIGGLRSLLSLVLRLGKEGATGGGVGSVATRIWWGPASTEKSQDNATVR